MVLLIDSLTKQSMPPITFVGELLADVLYYGTLFFLMYLIYLYCELSDEQKVLLGRELREIDERRTQDIIRMFDQQ